MSLGSPRFSAHSRRTFRPLFIAGLLLALGGTGGWWFMHHRTDASAEAKAAPAATAAKRPPTPVTVEHVKVTPLEVAVETVGTLESNESVDIGPEVDGIIAAIHFHEGTPVTAGTPLFTLDQSILKAELAKTQAVAELSRKSYARANELRRSGTISQQAFDDAAARMKSEEASVMLAQSRLEKTVLKAPFGGVVGLRRVSIGDTVKTGDVLVHLEDTSQLKVDFRVPEKYISRLRTGQTVHLAIEGVQEPVQGEVYAIDPRVDSTSHSLQARARIPNAHNALKPGMFGRLRLVLETREAAMIIPEAAVVPVGQQFFVYTVEGTTATSVAVQLGERQRGHVEILSGLKPESVVVTDGSLRLRDGADVTPTFYTPITKDAPATTSQP